MGYVFDFCDAVALIDPVITIQVCIQQTAYEIISFNCIQLQGGVTSLDVKLHRYDPKLKYYGKQYPAYKGDLYQNFKNSLNSKPGLGNPDLFLTGEFYKGIGVVVTRTEYTVSSNSETAPRLELKYGSQIYGLTQQNQGIYCQETLGPAIIRSLVTQIGL